MPAPELLVARARGRRAARPRARRRRPSSSTCSPATAGAGHGAVRGLLRRPSVRDVGRSARRWARDHARRGRGCGRRARGRAGQTWEMQLKGAGPTPYSRRADGRAVLRSSLRELVCSEAMHHLGVPTTRALSLVADRRSRSCATCSTTATRASSRARSCAGSRRRSCGSAATRSTASRDDLDTLRALVRFTLERCYPHYLDGDRLDVAGFFAEVMRRTACMVAEWMRVGFVHGVMNTDNMSILGLTIDYGPYGWLESFDLDWTPNITDASGRRYRFGNQPQVAQWNLGAARARARAARRRSRAAAPRARRRSRRCSASLHRHSMLRKLGLTGHGATATEDEALLDALGGLLLATETDMTLFFRRLARVPAGTRRPPPSRSSATRTTRPRRSPRPCRRTSATGSRQYAARVAARGPRRRRAPRAGWTRSTRCTSRATTSSSR